MNCFDKTIKPPIIERFFVNDITSDLFVGKWNIRIVIAVNTANPVVATYAYGLYFPEKSEYNIIKLLDINKVITPIITQL